MGGGKPKCSKKEKAKREKKAKAAYERYKRARDTAKSRREITEKACGEADTECDPGLFEGLEGDELRKQLSKCSGASNSCGRAEGRSDEADFEEDVSEGLFDNAQDILAACCEKPAAGGSK